MVLLFSNCTSNTTCLCFIPVEGKFTTEEVGRNRSATVLLRPLDEAMIVPHSFSSTTSRPRRLSRRSRQPFSSRRSYIGGSYETEKLLPTTTTKCLLVWLVFDKTNGYQKTRTKLIYDNQIVAMAILVFT